jgi:hypothetical protein
MRYMCNSCGTDVGGQDSRCAEHSDARINAEPDACARLYLDRATGFRKVCGRPTGHPGEHHGAGLAMSARPSPSR